MTVPVSRQERAVLDVLAAGVWSSTDVDRMPARRGERQEAIGKVLRDYRRDMHAHLSPAGKQ